MTHTYKISRTLTKVQVLAKTTWGYWWFITRLRVLIQDEKKKDQDTGYIKTELSILPPDFRIKGKCKKILAVTSDTKLLNFVLFFSKRLPSFWKQSIFQGSHSNRVLSLEIKCTWYMPTWTREKWDLGHEIQTVAQSSPQQDEKMNTWRRFRRCDSGMWSIPSTCCSETLIRNALLAVSWVLLRYKFQQVLYPAERGKMDITSWPYKLLFSLMTVNFLKPDKKKMTILIMRGRIMILVSIVL